MKVVCSISIRSEVLIGIVHLKMILFYYYLFTPKVIPILYDFLFFSVMQKFRHCIAQKERKKKKTKPKVSKIKSKPSIASMTIWLKSSITQNLSWKDKRCTLAYKLRLALTPEGRGGSSSYAPPDLLVSRRQIAVWIRLFQKPVTLGYKFSFKYLGSSHFPAEAWVSLLCLFWSQQAAILLKS